MVGRAGCYRYEATLDELLEDDLMAPVLRSAGLDAQGFREMIVETARRYEDGHSGDEHGDDRRIGDCTADEDGRR